MSYNPFSAQYDNNRRSGKYNTSNRAKNQSKGKRYDNAGKSKYFIARLAQLKSREKKLLKDPLTDPADLAQIRQEISETKAAQKRDQMSRNSAGDDAILK